MDWKGTVRIRVSLPVASFDDAVAEVVGCIPDGEDRDDEGGSGDLDVQMKP